MSSSGGGDGGIGALLAMQAANPMPGLPVAGANSTIGDPYDYGKFQNFLPDIQAEGQNPSATGLRPDMFVYRSPKGVVDQSDLGSQITGLRNQLAQLQAAGGPGGGAPGGGGGGGGGGIPGYSMYGSTSPNGQFSSYSSINQLPSTAFANGGNFPGGA